MVPTPTSTDLLMVIDPAISGNTKLSLFATMPVKNSELYGTHKRFKIAVLDSSFVSGSSIKDFYFQKYNQLPETRFKVFFEIKSTNLHTGFSSTPKSCETYGL